MVKLLRFKLMLLMAMVLMGASNVWGADITTSMTSFSAISGNVGGDTNISYAAAKGTASTAPTVIDNEIRVYQNGGTFTITANNEVKIKSVTLGSSMATTVTYSIDGGTASDNQSIAANGTITVNNLDCSSVLFTCTGNNKSTRLYVNSLSVTYSSEGSPSLSSIALSGEYPTTFKQGDEFSHDGLTVTASYDDKSTKNVTDYATFSGYDMSGSGSQKVTVSYTEGGVTKTAYYTIDVKALTSITLSGTYQTTFTEGDAFNHDGIVVTANYEGGLTKYVTGVATFSEPDMTQIGGQTITVSYGGQTTTYNINVNAIPTHNVTWSVNGVTNSESYKEGTSIVFPANPSAIEGKVFMGWTTTAISGTTDDTPTFVSSATMGTSDITYYAVFAKVTSGVSGTITDDLTLATTGITGTTYKGFTGKTASSTAVYAGQCAGGNDAIQLRSNNSNSGIVTTASGGKVQKIVVVWNSNTTDTRTIDIYGSNSAYSQATDLYDDKKQGTKLGSIIYGTSTELTVTGDYTFLGIRSNSGALYLNKVSVDWLSGSLETYSGYCTTVVADARDEAGLSFSEASATVELVSGYTGQALTNPNNVSPITWTSTDESVATVENGTVTLLAVGTTTIKAAFAGNDDFKEGEASYELTVQDSREAISLSFAEAEIELEMKDGAVAAPTLNGNTGNGTVTYSSDDTSVATVDSETGVVTAVAEGEAVITATVEGTAAYQGGTATFIVTVVDNYKKGSVNNPYTVAEARAAIDEGTGVTGVYATGIVSEIVTAFNPSYGNISYNVSADGTTSGDQLQAFRGKSFDGDDFASANDIQVGDKVVLYGNLKKYKSSTYEFDENNEVVSLKQPVAVSTANYRTFASVRAHDFTAVEGLTAYTASASEKKVSFTAVTKAVPAETGLLLKGEAATYYVPVVASADPVEGNALVGVTTSEEKPAGIFVLMNGAKGVGFYKTTNTFTLGANTAYLPASVGSRLFIGFNDDGEEATGINGVKEMKENRAIYNLRGMRVTTPSKGLYIIGGKKVVIK